MPMHELNGLQLIRLHFKVEFGNSGTVSHDWGNTLRGGFGHALRDISCALRRDNCGDCILGRDCAYGYLFETPIQASDAVMRKYTNAPHPFVIEPPASRRSFASEEEGTSFAFVLIGRAHKYLPHVLLAINRLGELGLGRDRVTYQVSTVTSDSGEVFYDRAAGRHVRPATPEFFSLDPGKHGVKKFSLIFESPLRLQNEGRILERPNIFDIVSALRRRAFLLNCFHGEGDGTQLSGAFLDAATEVVTNNSSFFWSEATRRSTRQQREIPLGGVLGRLDCEGDFGVLHPLLKIGDYVHVGKNATFGLGRMRTEEGDTT